MAGFPPSPFGFASSALGFGAASSTPSFGSGSSAPSFGFGFGFGFGSGSSSSSSSAAVTGGASTSFAPSLFGTSSPFSGTNLFGSSSSSSSSSTCTSTGTTTPLFGVSSSTTATGPTTASPPSSSLFGSSSPFGSSFLTPSSSSSNASTSTSTGFSFSSSSFLKTTPTTTTDAGTPSTLEVPVDDPSCQDTSTAQTKSPHIPEGNALASLESTTTIVVETTKDANTLSASEILVDEPSCQDTSTTQTNSPHISARNALSFPESMATNVVETTKDTDTLSASEVSMDEPYRQDTSSTQNDPPITPEALSATVEKLRQAAMKFSSLGCVGGDPSLASVRDQIRTLLKELGDRPILFDKYDDLMVVLDQFKAQTAATTLPGALSRIDCLKEVLIQAQTYAQSYRNKAPALHQAEQAGANVVARINKVIARISEPHDKATLLRERRTKLSVKVTYLEAQLGRIQEKLQGTKAKIETIDAELPSIDQELAALHKEVQTCSIAADVELDKAAWARLERQELQLQLSQLAQQAFQYRLVLDDM